MQKKIIVFILAAAVLMSVAACGKAPEEPPVAVNTEATQEATTEATEETVPEVAFAEQVLVDDDNCAVKITGIEEDTLWGYTLKVYLENKTDMELMYTLEGVSVNGFMCDPFWASSVTAKMKANEEIPFSDEDFEKNGIQTPTDISFTLRVYDNNDWSADALVEQEFTVYPMGEDAVQTYERAEQPEDIVLFDNEQCRMIVTGFEMDDIWGYTMKVYLENKTDKELMFSTDGVAVNGFMCDPYWAESVAAGKRSNTEITWLEESFAENGITEVTEIVLPVRVYDSNDWQAEDIVKETFTVTP